MLERRRVLVWLAILAGAGAVGWLSAPDPEALPPGGDFRLLGAAGPLRRADLAGRVGVLYFGYASCPDVCPVALGLLGSALATLGPEDASRVQAVFVSLDPARDTPERLAAYVANFHERLAGATADAETLAELAPRYGVRFRLHGVDSAVGYVVDHTSQLAVLDASGALAEIVPDGTPVDGIAAAIRRHLPGASPAPPLPTRAAPSSAAAAPPASGASAAAPAPAGSAAATLEVADAWVRALGPGGTVSAAYFALRNPTATARALVAARTPAAAAAELHAVLSEQGLTSMRPVDRIEVPAGGEARLLPSGHHVMLVGVVGALEAGATVPLTLVFDDGSELQLDAPVR